MTIGRADAPSQQLGALDLAAAAAVEAGHYLADLERGTVPTVPTTGRDVKIGADASAEAIVLRALRAESAHPILSEEEGGPMQLPSGPLWVVDPLDGSANYIRHIPASCVSVALVLDGEPILGAVYDFNRDELFTGIVGVGAWLGPARHPRDRTLSVSAVSRAEDAYLATGLPVARDFTPGALTEFVDELRRFKKVRILGSAALSLAYVACGRADAYAEDDIMMWDVSAGLALVQAAGGWVDYRFTGTERWTLRVRAAARAAVWTGDPGHA